ncbi:MAG TPA: hypothetical protein VGB14_09770 [Acidimicrobiales bacterium]
MTTRAAFEGRYMRHGFVELDRLSLDQLRAAAENVGVTGIPARVTKALLAEAITESLEHPPPFRQTTDDPDSTTTDDQED